MKERKITSFILIILVFLLYIKRTNLVFVITIYTGIIIDLLLLEEYCRKENYNYDEENPNALIKGANIAGTVYASYPNDTPGLGWIL